MLETATISSGLHVVRCKALIYVYIYIINIYLPIYIYIYIY